MERNRSRGVYGGDLHASGEPEHAVSGGSAGPADLPDAQPKVGLASLFERAHEYAMASGSMGAGYIERRQAYIDGWLAHARCGRTKGRV